MTGFPCTRAATIAGILVLVGGACSASAHGPTTSPASATSRASTPAPPRTGTGTSSAATSKPGSSSTPLVATPEPWSLPDPVSRPVVLPDGADFVILGGLAPGDVSTSRIVQVDPASGQSQLAGQLALAVHDSAGAQLHGEWFVFGGGSYSTVAEVQAWVAGRATQIATLPAARSDLSSAVVGGTAYVVGGFDGTSMAPDILATTDGVSFRAVGHLAVPVRYAAVAAAGGDLWVVGGVTSTSEGGTAETDAIQRFDLGTGRTTVVGHLPQPMGHATAIVLGGQVYVIGGRADTVPSSAIWRIDAASGTVQPAGHLPQAISDAGSVVVGGVGYLVGGEVTGPQAPQAAVVALRPTGG